MSKKRNRKPSRTTNASTRIEALIKKVDKLEVVENPENIANLNKSGIPTCKHLKTAAMLGRIARGIPEALLIAEKKVLDRHKNSKKPSTAAGQLRKKIEEDKKHVLARGFILKAA